jgi:Immunity protein 26
MNLAVLKKTRRTLEVGDIFVMQPPDGQFLFGRVVDTNADPLGAGGAVLIYIYRVRSAAKTPVPELLRELLLVPPIMTNKLPWTKGYFEHVENRPLSAMDRLSQHCFKSTSGRYFDQIGNPLAGPAEPVGQWGLHSYRTIDDEISKALGIPLSPDE